MTSMFVRLAPLSSRMTDYVVGEEPSVLKNDPIMVKNSPFVLRNDFLVIKKLAFASDDYPFHLETNPFYP